MIGWRLLYTIWTGIVIYQPLLMKILTMMETISSFLLQLLLVVVLLELIFVFTFAFASVLDEVVCV